MNDGRFKKGQSGNPAGSGLIYKDPAIKAVRELTYQEFVGCIQRFGGMTRAELRAEMERPEATVFEVMFGKVLQQAMGGERASREYITDRLWGKPKEVDAALVKTIDITPENIHELYEIARRA